MSAYDLDRGIKTRFTSDPPMKRLAAWTPAGDGITYGSVRNGNVDMVSRPSGGNGEAKLLVNTPLNDAAPDWSPDRRFLIYMAGPWEVKSYLLYPGAPRRWEPGRARGVRESGRFIAYVSEESGRNEIYVRDFPKGAARWQISGNGGAGPRRKPNGGEIFYVEGQEAHVGRPHYPARICAGRPQRGKNETRSPG